MCSLLFPAIFILLTVFAFWKVFRARLSSTGEEMILMLREDHHITISDGAVTIPCKRYLFIKRISDNEWEAVSPGYGIQRLTSQGLDSLFIGGWEPV